MKSNRRREGVSIQQVADVLGVHHMTVRRWVRRGYILAYRIGPSVIRIPRSEILRMRAIRLSYLRYGDRPEYCRI